MDRYARQRLLAVVGDSGQQRIARATFVVASERPLAAEVERDYLARAGAEHFSAPGERPPEFAHAAVFHHGVARDFAEGAWRALSQLNSALEPSQ
jgi:hypothetical protein